MIWRTYADGYRCDPYTLRRNSRGGFAAYIATPEGLRLLHAEIEGARAAKSFVEHWAELVKQGKHSPDSLACTAGAL